MEKRDVAWLPTLENRHVLSREIGDVPAIGVGHDDGELDERGAGAKVRP